MRILVMADTPPNPDSGAAGTELQTVQALRRMGHKVDTVWADELPHRISHGNLHCLLEMPFAYRKRMSERLKLHDYDVVHVSQSHGYLAARRVHGKAGMPIFVHRSHGFEPRVGAALAPWLKKFGMPAANGRSLAQQAMAQLLKFNHGAITRFADGHIVSSSLCASYLVDHYAVPAHRVCTIAQAAPDDFQTTPTLPLNEKRLSRLLYVGQFAFFKAPMVLAEAFGQIAAAYPDVRLTWVCDKKHHRDAAALLSSEALDRVDFLGWVGQQALRDIFDRHGVFLFPSFFEGFGKASLEAMSRGLAVISSAEGGAVDIIKNWSNGVLVRVGQADDIVASYCRLREETALAIAIGASASATTQQYSWDRVAQESSDFYVRLIAMKHGGLPDAR